MCMGRTEQERGIRREVKKGRVYKLNRLIRKGFTLKVTSGQIHEGSEESVESMHREECFRQREELVQSS